MPTESGPLVKFKFNNFKPVNYEGKKTENDIFK
jgi:hypothetical protein